MRITYLVVFRVEQEQTSTSVLMNSWHKLTGEQKDFINALLQIPVFPDKKFDVYRFFGQYIPFAIRKNDPDRYPILSANFGADDLRRWIRKAGWQVWPDSKERLRDMGYGGKRRSVPGDIEELKNNNNILEIRKRLYEEREAVILKKKGPLATPWETWIPIFKKKLSKKLLDTTINLNFKQPVKLRLLDIDGWRLLYKQERYHRLYSKKKSTN